MMGKEEKLNSARMQEIRDLLELQGRQIREGICEIRTGHKFKYMEERHSFACGWSLYFKCRHCGKGVNRQISELTEKEKQHLIGLDILKMGEDGKLGRY